MDPLDDMAKTIPLAGPAAFRHSRVLDRTSFTSVKERAGSLAQCFSETRVSSTLDESAIDDDPPLPLKNCRGHSETQLCQRDPQRDTQRDPHRRPAGPVVTSPGATDGLLSPCPGFLGWNRVAGRGKVTSKSYEDFRTLRMGWQWEVQPDEKHSSVEVIEVGPLSAAQVEKRTSVVEALPMEILINILDHLQLDLPPINFSTRNGDLMALLLTSRTLHSITLATLYSKVTIPHSRIFHKFLSHVKLYPALGTIVRRLDFSHFNPTGAGITARKRRETPYLIAATLRECLDLTPNLREFLIQEHVDDDIDCRVMEKLLCGLPNLKALDFCAASTCSFTDAFTSILAGPSSPVPPILPLTRLCLHECTTLPTTVFEALLPRLVSLTHLDVAHTRITDLALRSIPLSARLTHLNVSRCSRLTSETVVHFLAQHPAARGLVYLNLAMDVKSSELLASQDVSDLLPILPITLKSLNLKGSKMTSAHLGLLAGLTQILEELGLGRHLTLSDLGRLVLPGHGLHYLDLSDLSAQELDLGALLSPRSPLLGGSSEPLEVIEVSSDVATKLERHAALARIGWCLQEAGRRAWLVRQATTDPGARGARPWKWGATFWGMRKVPVARSEVGGMYGHYMFKR